MMRRNNTVTLAKAQSNRFPIEVRSHGETRMKDVNKRTVQLCKFC